MTKWIREHIHTIAALLAGIVVGGIIAFLSGFWLVVSGNLGEMLIAGWGY